MEVILNNPIWHALASDQSALGDGNTEVNFFLPEVAPFAGLREYNPDNFQLLFDLLDAERVVVLFSPVADLDPLPWNILVKVPGYQMVFEGEVTDEPEETGLVSLRQEHVGQMLALTELTQPGPFLNRTIEFGHYRGIFEQGQLVAMGGQRLRSAGFTEISAICTHPEHAGKGYARKIIEDQIRIIRQNGETPYLHVRADNIRAIDLYQRMGFVIRTDIYFYVLKK